MSQSRQRRLWNFTRGTMNGKEVVVVRSGIGKVNAGICTQILCDLYHVDAVINTGIAGSLNAKIDIGDIVLSTDALQHDMDATGFGYEPGVIPRMETSTFIADEKLRKLAKECCERVNPDIHVFEDAWSVAISLFLIRRKKEFILNTFVRRLY